MTCILQSIAALMIEDGVVLDNIGKRDVAKLQSGDGHQFSQPMAKHTKKLRNLEIGVSESRRSISTNPEHSRTTWRSIPIFSIVTQGFSDFPAIDLPAVVSFTSYEYIKIVLQHPEQQGRTLLSHNETMDCKIYTDGSIGINGLWRLQGHGGVAEPRDEYQSKQIILRPIT